MNARHPSAQGKYFFSARSAAVLSRSNASVSNAPELRGTSFTAEAAAPEDGHTPLNRYQGNALGMDAATVSGLKGCDTNWGMGPFIAPTGRINLLMDPNVANQRWRFYRTVLRWLESQPSFEVSHSVAIV